MIELVYIGEEYPAQAPAFVRPFQHKETEMQLTWADVVGLMSQTTVSIRPPEAEEIQALEKHIALIRACSSYLSQFVEADATAEGA